MPELAPNSLPIRSRTQRIGLIAGPLLFAIALALPSVPGLHSTAAESLHLQLGHPSVTRLAESAQATFALALLMVAWWVTEAVPIPITSLLPGLLLPMLGVVGVRDGELRSFTSTAAFAGYASPVIYLFLAGFLLAAGMRKSGLDRRITLTMLSGKHAASGPATLLLSVMAATAFLSLWVSNTATAAMMMPIAAGVLHTLGERPGESRLGGALMLGVAWSASIGGMGTIIGSPPNGIVVGIIHSQGMPAVSYVGWMAIGMPMAAVSLVAAWLLLLLLFRPDTRISDSIRAELIAQKRSLGAWSRDEVWVMLVFLLAVFLWMSEPVWPLVLPVAAARVMSRFGIYEIGLACALLLFVVPVERGTWRAVLRWDDSRYVDWGTLILFGGGIALSDAMFATSLTNWLASGFIGSVTSAVPIISLIAVVLLIDFLTEITSNTAVAAMICPILVVLAPQLGQDARTLCMVAGLASSLAFMLPVATPPNALVYGTGYFRIGQMIGAGFLMNLLGCAILVAITYLCGPLFAP